MSSEQEGRSRESGPEFVGRSHQAVKLRMLIERLGRRHCPVLIQGESGTGKEVVARSLFNASPRGQFVPIDCATLVGTMMESELFGHVRGAFTGAVDTRKGLIELANGGTAFFDEIGELPIELQAKLLRVLQESEVRPVGSLQRIRLEVRVIAATNRDLVTEVAAGRFREDLFYRLNVVCLTIPPLRDRKEDIPLLIERFLAATGGRYLISHDSLEAMLGYDWPGNVRELKNCLERMMAYNSGPLLQFCDLPEAVSNHARAHGETGFVTAAVGTTNQLPHPAGAAPIIAEQQRSSGEIVPLSEMERHAIGHALERTHGDRTLTAHLLHIGRTTLYRKIKEYELE